MFGKWVKQNTFQTLMGGFHVVLRKVSCNLTCREQTLFSAWWVKKQRKASAPHRLLATTSFWMFIPSWFQAQDSVERWKDDIPNNNITLGSNQAAIPTEERRENKRGTALNRFKVDLDLDLDLRFRVLSCCYLKCISCI